MEETLLKNLQIRLLDRAQSSSPFNSSRILHGRLEPISKLPEEDNEAGELNKAQEILGMVLPADEDSAPMSTGRTGVVNYAAKPLAGEEKPWQNEKCYWWGRCDIINDENTRLHN